MRVIQLKKYFIFKIVTLFFIFISLCYLFIQSYKNENSSRSTYIKEKVKLPILIDGLGNFEPKHEHERVGPGEGGKPHYLRPDQENDAKESITNYGINIICSNEISLNRSVPDLRLPECKHWQYPTELPKASVIIVFFNEGLSVILRTVYSVINRTPPQFLEEIILVDDFSDKENLKGQLEFIITKFNGKVRILRNKEREGLIRTRSAGAQRARGEVIVFLDAHCEVNVNWLPPLLAPIAYDRSTMTVPIVDGINYDTFEFTSVYKEGTHFRGIFEWGMLYKETELSAKEVKARRHQSEPFNSPTHAGGLLAINREYFLELGGYDPGLLLWGGENFELSFKIWQCGGRLLWVPCSRVGHVYRGFVPYSFGNFKKKKGPLVTINYKRVIETWFDDKYKEYFYTRLPSARSLDMGDISEQKKLKERLNCKSFDWFMKNIAYDVTDQFPELPPNIYWGELRNEATQTCLDTMGNEAPAIIELIQCHGQGTNQLFRLNAKGQLGVGERCIEADSKGISLAFCNLGTTDGPWHFDEHTHVLDHKLQNKCLAVNPESQQLYLSTCDLKNAYQKFVFKETYQNL